MTFIVLGAGALLVVIAAIVAVQGDRVDYARIEAAARGLGWRTTRGADTNHEWVEIETGGPGRIRVTRRRPRSTGPNRQNSRSGGRWTHWSTNEGARSGVLAVRSGRPIPPGALAMGAALLQPLLAAALAEVAGRDIGPVGTLHALATGDAAFDAGHAVLSTDPGAAVTPELRRVLTGWAGPGKLALLASPTGLRVMVEGKALADGKTLTALEEVGRLCLAAVSRGTSAPPAP